MLALLNGALCEWYFRLGSSNAMVSEYQLNNLPCPVFAAGSVKGHHRIGEIVVAAITAGRLDEAFDTVAPALAHPPFPAVVADVLVELVNRIIVIEKSRGPIARSERSALAPAAQPLQALIDRIIFTMAGLNESEAAGLQERLARML